MSNDGWIDRDRWMDHGYQKSDSDERVKEMVLVI